MFIVLQSFLLVAAAEMGDKTQLLAFVLASRYRKPWTVLSAILVATVLNHLLASLLGSWISQAVPPPYLKWGLACTFFAFALWVLVPDKESKQEEASHFGAFLTTLLSFFLAEMGDKTQLSTMALAAKYDNIVLVTLGTTLGMLFSDGLAVFFGKKITTIVPLPWIHRFSALLFVAMGVGILLY